MTEPAWPSGPDALKALYRETIRAHAANPYGFERPIAATHAHELYNALCGDRVNMMLRVEQETIAEAAFHGEACAICMASASLLCGLAPGETVTQLRELTSSLSGALCTSVGGRLRPKSPSAASGLLQVGDSNLREELHPLLGVRPYPSRVRCATLPWEAAVAALDQSQWP